MRYSAMNQGGETVWRIMRAFYRLTSRDSRQAPPPERVTRYGATLEDWFDPRRLRDDYVPTEFKPFDRATLPVKGHRYGLGLADADRRALIAFLKTL